MAKITSKKIKFDLFPLIILLASIIVYFSIKDENTKAIRIAKAITVFFNIMRIVSSIVGILIISYGLGVFLEEILNPLLWSFDTKIITAYIFLVLIIFFTTIRNL